MAVRRVCVVVGSRANYSSIKSVMRAIEKHPDLELQLVVGASALLDRYGSVVDIIEKDGFKPTAKVYMLVEGETPSTMAKSTGLGLLELPTIFENLTPDVVLTVGDRFETMATTLAATYMNIPLAHTMGGEVTGNIDEQIRHAVTKFAHIHFPACEEARERIIRLGENPDSVHTVGCPRIDLVADVIKNHRDVSRPLFAEGVGPSFSIEQGKFVIVSQHPVTNEYGAGEEQITVTLEGVRSTGFPAVVLWPNADAGAEDVARGIRKFREKNSEAPFHYVKNLPPEVYMPLMDRAACVVGNSSSGIREGAFMGSPAVNIGTRQDRRQRGKNVIDVGYDIKEIADSVKHQARVGKYPSEPIYGDGQAGVRIADILGKTRLSIEKKITY